MEESPVWRVARLRVPGEKAERMQVLATKQQSEGLSEGEQEVAEQLLRQATCCH